MKIDIDKIVKQGCWKNEKTFKKYYDKEIISNIADTVDFHKIMS